MNEIKSLDQLKEELRKEIIGEVLDIVRDEIEENFSEEFVSSVEEAETRAEQGGFTSYTAEELREKFL